MAPEGPHVPRSRAVRDRPRVPLLLRARDDVQDEPRPGQRRALAVRLQRPRGQLPLGLLELRDDRARHVPLHGHELPHVAPQHGAGGGGGRRDPPRAGASRRLRPCAPRRWLGAERRRRDLPRLPRPPDAPLPAALPADHEPGSQGLALVADPRLPVVHDPVRDLAPDGVLQDHPAGARGGGARRRLLAALRARAHRLPGVAPGNPDGGHLRLLALCERVHLRVHLDLELRAADHLGRDPERPHPRRRLLLAVAHGGDRDSGDSPRAALQRVPRPFHQGLYRGSIPVNNRTRKGGVPVTDLTDELVGQSSALTRDELLNRGAAAAFAVSMFGGLADKALGFSGPHKYTQRQLAGELRILQWAHFVPSYDQWLDNTYIKQWGEKNDVDVKIDHINNALLFSTASSEVAAQSGHDLFQFLNPPSSFQKQVIPLNDIVQEVTRKLGPMTKVGQRSCYNPRTKQFFGFPDNYAPDPVQYRRSYLQEAGVSLNTWDDLRRGAPKLKQMGHPVGLGMSNEIDSNMFLIALLYCYGGFVQNEAGRIAFKQGSNPKGAVEAPNPLGDLHRDGTSD